MTTVKILKRLKSEIPNVDFMVGGNESGGGSMGLLGRNVLAVKDTEYDLAHGAVRLTFPKGDCEKTDMAYWAGNTPVVELPLLRERALGKRDTKVMVKLNGVDVVAFLDTGAYSMITLKAARRAGVAESSMTPARAIRGAGRGEAKAWVAPIDKVQIGGETITNN